MRLIHAVREINETRAEPITVIALYTEPERQAMFVRHADEAYCLGPATAVGADGRRRNGYLDHAALERALVADAARTRSGPAGASSPRTPRSSTSASASGIVFVGPSGDVDAPPRRQDRGQAARRGRRRAGRAVERRAGRRRSRTPSATRGEIGFPLMVKAAAGGGGRGIRRVDAPATSSPPRSRAPAPRRTTRSATTRSSWSGWSRPPATSRCR